jgi:isochorismate synthase
VETLHDIIDKTFGYYEAGRAFALYAKPSGTAVQAVFLRADGESKSGLRESGFVFAPFDGEPILLPFSHCDRFEIGHLPNAGYRRAPGNIQRLPTGGSGKHRFETLVRKGIEAIRCGRFSKLVLSRKERVEVEAFDFYGVFERLLSSYPTAFRYAFFHPRSGFWLGATPERLLKLDNGKLQTVALAGTQKDPGEGEAVWGEKEKTEQQYVTDFIVRSLQGHVSELKISEPHTVAAGLLLHIRTDISATLMGNPGEIVRTLHPTPAVCGLPKAGARQFITENEGYDRQFYSGYLGEWYPAEKSADLYVNLRCMQWEDGAAQLYVGCGITADSDPEMEFMETVNKAMTIKNIL